MRTRIVLLSGCFAVLLALPAPAHAQRLSLPGVLSAPLHILRGITGAVRGQAYRGRHGVSRRSMARGAAPAAAAATATAAAAETTGSGAAGVQAPSSNAAVSAWNGPLFWPNAYDGMFEYAFGVEDGQKFWARGYGDVVEGMFVPSRAPRVAEAGNKPAWAALCGGDTQGSAQAIANRIRDAVKPTEEQGAAFEELSSSLGRGFEAIKAVCPTGRAATPTERLNLMIARLSAMRQAVLAVSGGAKSFYATLSDEQKAAFDGPPDVNAGALCAGGPVEWPQREIARMLRPTRQQYPEFERLRQTSMHLAQFVGSTCPGERPKTTVERLDAVKERLSALRYAALNTGPALNRFYLALNTEQKSRLAAPGGNARAEVRR